MIGARDSATPGVAGLARAIAAGELSATDVVASHLASSAASQDHLNAYTLIDFDRAEEAAADVDARLASGDAVGRLAGVPLAIKDLIDHQGRPNTCGSSFPPIVPDVSATVVARLEAAGAVIIGRTGLHEFAFGFSSENHWSGPVCNPWNTALSPGGSSGGSGAAVAAGVAAGALGTDTGGSVRVPAALCGIVGLKVTHGRVPLTGVYPLASSVDTVGPMARSVEDVALLYEVIAGDDPADPWSTPMPVEVPGGPADPTTLVVGLPHPWIDQPMVDSVRLAFETAMAALADAGAQVVDVDLPLLDPPGMIEQALYPEVATVHRERWHAQPEGYGPDVGERLAAAFDVTADQYAAGLRWRTACRHQAMRAFQQCDVLATPTVAALEKPIGEEEIEVAGKRVSYRGPLSRFSSLVNHMLMPAIALPLPMGPQATHTEGAGPPPSLQLIGRQWSEASLLAIGLALEQTSISAPATPPTQFT